MEFYLIDLHSNKSSPYNRILLNGISRPKLLNIPLAQYSCCLLDLDFIVPHTEHFNNSVVLLLPVFETLVFMLSVFTVPHTEHFNNSVVLLLPVFGTLGFMFSVLFYTLNKMIALLYT